MSLNPTKKTRCYPFQQVTASLSDIAGADYINAVCDARAWLCGEDGSWFRKIATEKIDFFPPAFMERQLSLLEKTGQNIGVAPLGRSVKGASTRKFVEATKAHIAPLSGFGMFRLAENGRLYLITKSEHYHAPLGHSFPGYELINRAHALGIPNATHNNTRGHITRLLEERLIAAANSLPESESAEAIIASESTNGLNRVLNLETGSLAVEAALKMILTRFYRIQADAAKPKYDGKIPVILVMGNDDGGLHANYHGTTVLTQMMRGMWDGFYGKMEAAGIFKVHAIRPNRFEDVEQAFAQYEKGGTKIAGFFHEIVMMNYGAVKLDEAFLQKTYALCEARDVPTVVDEIQSCMWAPGFFMFPEYGLKPTFAAVGKGFPGGQYPASRILFNSRMDCQLPQFGALVTNGQEELASLAYLITMRWAGLNREVIRDIGDYYESRLRDFSESHKDQILSVSGSRHMCGLVFDSLKTATDFAGRMVEMGMDVSAQTYKADCPPVVLTKLPLIVTREVIDYLIGRMEEALASPVAEVSAEAAGM